MLTRVAAAFAAAVLTMFLPVGVPAAFAGDGEVCDLATNTETGQVEWICVDVDTDGGEDGDPDDSGEVDGSSTASVGSTVCRSQGKEIPCKGPGGSIWNGTCYVGAPITPQPATGPNGEAIPAEGQYHVCYLVPPAQGPGQIWVVPGTPSVDPQTVANRAIAAMDLDPIGVGIVPKSGPGRMGLVGLPVWMWVNNPEVANSWGPVTESATDGPVTVTATATVSEVIWNMGDGSEPISCGAGTPYEDAYGRQDSPTCGYRYMDMSGDQPKNAYKVTATSLWVIEWTGGGMDGTIELNITTAPRLIRIGEAQVIGQ